MCQQSSIVGLRRGKVSHLLERGRERLADLLAMFLLASFKQAACINGG